jgi:hypothetical protein
MEEDGGEVQRGSSVDTLEVEERDEGLKARVLEGLKR